MNRVYVLPPRENWIVDRLVSEWCQDNSDITVYDPRGADVVWLFADWCWRHIPIDFLRSKKVITTVHHIVPEKFGDLERQEFLQRDKITTVYHVPNFHTRDFISQYTNKKISVISYWANQNLWKKTGTKKELRLKHGLKSDDYIVGSFQRDTEGSDLISPKLEKGPDLFVDYVRSIEKENLHILLSGWRRQYVIENLKMLNVPFTYIERPDTEVINELYQCLDIYPVTSRYEGGPQAILECGLLGIPVISRDVGIASMLLPERAISSSVEEAFPEIPCVEGLSLPEGYSKYRNLIKGL